MYLLLIILAIAAPAFTIATGLQGAVLTITTEFTGVVEYPVWWIFIFDGLLLVGALTRRLWALIIAASPCFPLGLELYAYMRVAEQPTSATVTFYATHIFLYAACALIGFALLSAEC